MIFIIILALLNLILSAVTTYGLGLPGFDLTLAGVILVALRGDNVLLAAVLLSVAYALPKPDRFIWVPMQLLSAWLVGWLVVTFGIVYISMVIFYIIATCWSAIFGNLGGRFIMHTMINLGLTLLVLRFYFLMT